MKDRIEKKAFFGQRNLRNIVIPKGVQSIEDWAFASCRNLEIVEFETDDVLLGRDVFQKCTSLRKIVVAGKHPDVGFLLAAVPCRLAEPYLLNLKEAGGTSWIERFDSVLLARLKENELEGYSAQFVCGEEDSGRKDEEVYREEQRMEKLELVYLRLLHPYKLAGETETILRTYFMNHRKGCASEATWAVLLKNHGEDMAYAKLYLEIAGKDKDFELDAHLKDIGEVYPELKGFLLRGSEGVQADFFAGLDL